MTLRIATRRSPLAMWQARHVAAALVAADPGLEVEFVSMDTWADRRLDRPISALGGKGAFSKEVQQLVLEAAADLAVHSAKDLQAETPPGLQIAAVPERGDPRDAVVGASLARLAAGCVVATGSSRRRVQLAHRHPELRFVGLRGNIATRLAALDGDIDALVMASAAIERLGLDRDDVTVLDVDEMVPQVGQGCLAVECRADDDAVRDRLAAIDHAPSRRLLETERAFLRELGGDCDLPAGAHARRLDDGGLELTGVLAPDDESELHRHTVRGDDGALLGVEVARHLRTLVP